MIGGKGAGGELWLRAVCLAASLGLHVGLGAISWQGAGLSPADSGPIMVTLAEGLSAQAAPASRSASGGRSGRPARQASPAFSPQQPAPPAVEISTDRTQNGQAETALCAVPETTVVAAVNSTASLESLAGEGGEGRLSPAVGGEGSAIGLAAGSGGAEGGAAGGANAGLVLATPRYASNPKPEYPRLARQNRWEGIVNLRATISAAGEVETVTVEHSSGHQVLDNSAVGGVRRWRFVPARQGDAQVPCEVRIPVAFRLESKS